MKKVNVKHFSPLSLGELHLFYKYTGLCGESDVPFELHEEIGEEIKRRMENKSNQIEGGCSE